MRYSPLRHTPAFRFVFRTVFFIFLSGLSSGDALAGMSAVQQCATIRNDDTVRAYDPSMKGLFSKAIADFGAMETASTLRTATYRCMDGHLYGCIIGANLPCSKLNTARSNPGADAFCMANPQAGDVPMVASGHETVYDYTCVSGRAKIRSQIYKLDQRGFAEELWKRLD